MKVYEKKLEWKDFHNVLLKATDDHIRIFELLIENKLLDSN